MGGYNPPHTYFGVARDLLPGIRRLLEPEPVSVFAIAMLLAHALECLLKAFLSRTGSDKRLVDDPKLRHNLVALWALAVAEGLPIDAVPPNWVAALSKLHAAPYLLRYATNVNVLVMPNLRLMADALDSIFLAVQDVVRNSP